MPPQSIRFTFSPALYPNTPLVNTPIFLHGEIVELKTRKSEQILKGRDEKGEWEAYVEQTPFLQKGMKIRAYGLIVPQPDGNTMLAAKWVKEIEEKEYEYCKKKTQEEWEKSTKENPSLEQLKPFEPPRKTPANQLSPEQPMTQSTLEPDTEFISAAQFKVERDYL